ncbi:Thoeris anti-defense Tad2 family protein [Xenorhabdus griffiniae]|nr:MW1434 family type I TA system toxin [Xenorhabdus griffiniae]MBD1228979.1 DUF2829 domain-containing protein [Xenorhabdus griffiniae]MBE8588914.1 DUF2829 domain-containing protein [Xenorhabdus griffiniae]
MSDVNKLDSTQCSFNPEQYKVKVTIENDTVAPVGSFPWALIQMYLNKTVRRKVWPTNMYIGMYTVNNNSNIQNIQVTGEYGNSGLVSWQPGQDDMTWCDWELTT